MRTHNASAEGAKGTVIRSTVGRADLRPFRSPRFLIIEGPGAGLRDTERKLWMSNVSFLCYPRIGDISWICFCFVFRKKATSMRQISLIEYSQCYLQFSYSKTQGTTISDSILLLSAFYGCCIITFNYIIPLTIA